MVFGGLGGVDRCGIGGLARRVFWFLVKKMRSLVGFLVGFEVGMLSFFFIWRMGFEAQALDFFWLFWNLM